MSLTRLYLVNIVMIDQAKVSTGPGYSWQIKSQQRVSYILGWLLFGNLVDNAFDPKVFLVVCSALLGLFFVCLGFYLQFFQGDAESVQQ